MLYEELHLYAELDTTGTNYGFSLQFKSLTKFKFFATGVFFWELINSGKMVLFNRLYNHTVSL